MIMDLMDILKQAKTGKNIKESMEFLIKQIIKRLEELNSK